MKSLWLWTLGTFVVALAVPLFWIPFLGLLIAATINSFNRRAAPTEPRATLSRKSAEKVIKDSQALPKIGEIEVSVSVSNPEANPDSREQTYREHVEHVVSVPNLYDIMPEESLGSWEKIAELVVLPPEEWRLEMTNGKLVVDANWKFFFSAKAETPWQLYLYSVKGNQELLKVGIAKDVLKRKEKYYSRCIKKWEMPRRDAIFIEELFKHATYGFHSHQLPQWNVGNIEEDVMLPSIQALMEEYPDSQGFTEVRQMPTDAAKQTIEQMIQDVKWNLYVDELLLKYGIKTFGGEAPGISRPAIEVPHLKWKLRPHDNERAEMERELMESAEGEQMKEIRAELYKEAVEEEKAIKKICWRPADWN